MPELAQLKTCMHAGALAVTSESWYRYTQRTLPQLMANIQCEGSESSLVDCRYSDSYCSSSRYSDVVSVFCQGETKLNCVCKLSRYAKAK